MALTRTKANPDTTQKVIGSAMVPDGEFEAALIELGQGHVAKDKLVLPLGVAVALHNWCVLLRRPALVWQ